MLNNMFGRNHREPKEPSKLILTPDQLNMLQTTAKAATKMLNCSRCGCNEWITLMRFTFDPLLAAHGQFNLVPTQPVLRCGNCRLDANETIKALQKKGSGNAEDEGCVAKENLQAGAGDESEPATDGAPPADSADGGLSGVRESSKETSEATGTPPAKKPGA